MNSLMLFFIISTSVCIVICIFSRYIHEFFLGLSFVVAAISIMLCLLIPVGETNIPITHVMVIQCGDKVVISSDQYTSTEYEIKYLQVINHPERLQLIQSISTFHIKQPLEWRIIGIGDKEKKK